MTSVLLDTSAYTAFKRGHGGIAEAIRSASELLFPAVALGELLAGFRSGTRWERNRAELDEFLASPRVRVVAVDAATAGRYAVIHASLRARGRPIATNDLWIAAQAMQHGAELLTFDRDYQHVPQILVRLFAV